MFQFMMVIFFVRVRVVRCLENARAMPLRGGNCGEYGGELSRSRTVDGWGFMAASAAHW